MAARRTYTDDQLMRAIADSRSWRGALRNLGLAARSAGAMRSVRTHAVRLGADFSHFVQGSGAVGVGVASSRTSGDLIERNGADSVPREEPAKGLAAGTGLSLGRMAARSQATGQLRPELSQLRRAGPLIAAAWFTLCGCEIAWPLEPCRYDLLVTNAKVTRRVQVKTTTVQIGRTWKAYLSTTAGGRRTYAADEIDEFFVVDGDGNCYVIPLAAVHGRAAIHLSRYGAYQVDVWRSASFAGATAESDSS